MCFHSSRVTGLPAFYFILWRISYTIATKMTETVADLLKKLTNVHEVTQKQITELQQQVTSSQIALTKLVVQKIEEEHGYTFRKKGHDKQWHFNKVMNSHLDNALNKLKKIPQPTDEKTSKIVDKVQEELTKGRDEIADCQKKIKMADRSDYCWGMVEAYERDELADNLANEKCMEKVIKEAERTTAKKKRMKQRGLSLGRKEPEQKRLSHWEPSERTGDPARFPLQPPLARQKAIGLCWSYGTLGHLVQHAQDTHQTGILF